MLILITSKDEGGRMKDENILTNGVPLIVVILHPSSFRLNPS
jgi:hypothetical protein